MMIRRPAADVYRAFIDPAQTTKFWFTKSSGPLQVGQPVRWEWEMYGFATDVQVHTLEENRRIVLDWGNYDQQTTVEWTFEPLGPEQTMVRITNSGFSGSEDQMLAKALDSTQGFAFLLAGAKAYLEHGIELHLSLDKAPYAHVKR